MKYPLRALALGTLCGVVGGGLASQVPFLMQDSGGQTDPLQRNAMMAPRALHGVMLAAAAVGNRKLVAGERGIVLWSDDASNWRQAKVPVSVTITALSMPTAHQGWAVGHGGTVLHTVDGGQTWLRQLDGRAAAQIELKAARAAGNRQRVAQAEQLVRDGPDKPFLAVHFWDVERGFVIGAYGMIFGTEDGGATWTSWSDRVQNPKGLHLNALYVSGGTVFLAGEQGLILHSADNARSFQSVESPYKGSWFAITGTGNTVVVAGLRGNAYRTTNGGSSWMPVPVPEPVSLGSAVATQDGTLLFANQAGVLLSSRDEGRTLQPVYRSPGPPLTALAVLPGGGLLAASFVGPVLLPPEGWRSSRP